MTKPENTFTRTGSIRIEWMPKDARFICWRPHTSAGGNTRRDVLRFARWPASTPTGQALRDWLNSLDLPEDTNTPAPQPDDTTTEVVQLSPEVMATGFGPECHDHDPTANTRTII